MGKDERKRSIVIIIALALVATVSVGYALMSSNILIKGTTGIIAENWDVHFTNLTNKTASSADVVVTSAAAIKELTTTPADTSDDLNIEFSISFKKPGDKYEFDVDVTNAGTLYAKCKSITPTIPADLQGYVTITTSGLAENDVLTPASISATATKTMHVVAQYADRDTLPSTAKSGDLQVGIEFEQTNPTS